MQGNDFSCIFLRRREKISGNKCHFNFNLIFDISTYASIDTIHLKFPVFLRLQLRFMFVFH